MVHYIIQTIVFQCLFLLLYEAFLKRETFFNWNRFYLLGTTILSFIIPYIKIESLKTVVSKEYVVWLPEIILGNQDNVFIQQEIPIVLALNTKGLWTWTNFVYLGIALASAFFLFKIFKVVYLIIANPKQKKENFTLVTLPNKNEAFSFFRYVFIGNNISEKEKEIILIHELVHVKQKHTIDLLLFEVLKTIFWFNPLLYIYQNRIASLHEFLADKKAVKYQNKKEYYQNLLAQIFQVKQVSIINPFFNKSLIKKRIVMLNKKQSKKVQLFKYALLFPLVVGMLFYTSCSQQEAKAVLADQEMEQVVEKFRNQLQTENSTLTKEERLELAEYIIDEFKANIEDNNQTSSGTFNGELVIMPFNSIDEKPIFPGCENALDRKECFSKAISKHIADNFNSDLAQSLGLEVGKHRISVQFKVNQEGNVVDANVRAPRPELGEEALRVINKLPKMKPGKHNGKAVTVGYGFPIAFQVNE